MINYSREDVQNIFSYDPKTGILTWKKCQVKRCNGKEAGTRSTGGYRYVDVNRVRHPVHRVICVFMGEDIDGWQVDHINGIRDDNRWENLRLVSQSQNSRNMRTRVDSKMGIHGVFWRSDKKKYLVQAWRHGVQHSLGYHKDFFEACCARKSAEVRLGYHPNHGRRAA